MSADDAPRFKLNPRLSPAPQDGIQFTFAAAVAPTFQSAGQQPADGQRRSNTLRPESHRCIALRVRA
jgi:hypothetical protein